MDDGGCAGVPEVCENPKAKPFHGQLVATIWSTVCTDVLETCVIVILGR